MPNDPARQFVSEATRAARCLRIAAKDPAADEVDRRRAEIVAKLIERVLASRAKRTAVGGG